jgi:hypothetical protein
MADGQAFLHEVDGLCSLVAHRYSSHVPEDVVDDLDKLSARAREYARAGVTLCVKEQQCEEVLRLTRENAELRCQLRELERMDGVPGD